MSPAGVDPSWKLWAPWIRALVMASLAMAGLLIGILGGFVQADRWVLTVPWGVLAIPWGAVLVLATLLLCVRGAAWLMVSRWGGGVLLTGWVLATLAMATQTPSGDLAISAGARQWGYVLAGVILGSAAVTFPVVIPRVDSIMEPGLRR